MDRVNEAHHRCWIIRPDGIVEVIEQRNGARLLIMAGGLSVKPELEARYSSRDYGSKLPSESACWKVRAGVPLAVKFVIVPVAANEDEKERIAIVSDARA